MSNNNGFFHLENIFNSVPASIQPIGDLVLDAGTQQRAKMDNDAVLGYTEAMKASGIEHWEAVKVFELVAPVMLPDGSTLEAGARLLVDGFHRVDAAVSANYDRFPMQVVTGTYEDAVYYSLIANKKNGVSLKGKDFQKAIKKLYALDAAWRAHGKKQELALLFGCSTKTVERAVKAIDDEIKSQAFNMFDAGATDNEVMEFSHKSLNTVKAWREDWELSKADPEGGDNTGPDGGDDNGATDDPTDVTTLTIAQAMKLKDPQVQAAILAILAEAYGIKGDTGAQQDEPQPEPEAAQPEDDEPPFSTDEEQPGVTGDAMEDLAAQWKAKGDAFSILDLTREKMDSYANKKAQLNRAYNKLLRQCHPDRFGKDNAALIILLGALAEVKAIYKIK